MYSLVAIKSWCVEIKYRHLVYGHSNHLSFGIASGIKYICVKKQVSGRSSIWSLVRLLVYFYHENGGICVITGLCCVLRYVLWHWNSIVPMLLLLSEFTWVLIIMINVRCLWFFLPFVYCYIIPSRGVYGILQNIECFNCSVDDIVA